jgi:hypothetical protein
VFAGAIVGVGAYVVAGEVRAAPPPPPSTLPSGDAPPTARGGDAGGSEGVSDPVIDQRTPTSDLTRTWGYSSRDAPPPNYSRSERESVFSVNPIGAYQGVSTFTDNIAPLAPPPEGSSAEAGGTPTLRSTGSSTGKATHGHVLTWTGFERGPGVARVFFQLTGVADYTVEQEGGRVVVRIPRTSVTIKNNGRRLDTQYFKGAVLEVTVKRDKADAVATILLRREAQAAVNMVDGRNGYKLLVLEFADAPEDAPLPSEP